MHCGTWATHRVSSRRDEAIVEPEPATSLQVLILPCKATQRSQVVGPAGLEPATKGFTLSSSFPTRVDYLFTRSSSELGGRGTL
jgi:hypothetical protein